MTRWTAAQIGRYKGPERYPHGGRDGNVIEAQAVSAATCE